MNKESQPEPGLLGRDPSDCASWVGAEKKAAPGEDSLNGEKYGQSPILRAKIWGKKANFPGLMFELKGSFWYEPQLNRHQLESSVMKNKYS